MPPSAAAHRDWTKPSITEETRTPKWGIENEAGTDQRVMECEKQLPLYAFIHENIKNTTSERGWLSICRSNKDWKWG